jgi:hypothetical protein
MASPSSGTVPVVVQPGMNGERALLLLKPNRRRGRDAVKGDATLAPGAKAARRRERDQATFVLDPKRSPCACNR